MTPEGCGDKEGIPAQGPCWAPITRLVRRGVAWAFTASGLDLLLTHPLLAYLFISLPWEGLPTCQPGCGLHCSPMQEFPVLLLAGSQRAPVGALCSVQGTLLEPSSPSRERWPILELVN